MNSTEEYLDNLLKSVTEGKEISAEQNSEIVSETPVMPEPERENVSEMEDALEPSDESVNEPLESPEEVFELPESTEEVPVNDNDVFAAAEETEDETAESAEPEPILEEIPPQPEDESSFTNDEELLEDEDITNLLKSIGEMGNPAEPADEPSEEKTSPAAGMEPEDVMDDSGNIENEITESSEDSSFSEIEELPKSFETEEEIQPDIAADDLLSDNEEQSGANEDADLSELLAGMSDDEELSEINELLNKNDNNEMVETDEESEPLSDEDLFNIEEPLSEEEDTGKKKKKKKPKKEKKKKEKKQSFLSKIFNSLVEEVAEPEAKEPEKVFAEETAAEIAQEGAAENEKILNEEEEEDTEKEGKKKGKKEKKPKKEKKAKKEKEPEAPQKKLPKKKVILIGILCFSFGVMITLLAFLFPYYSDMKDAQMEFDQQNYEQAFESLKGHRLNEKQQVLYDKTVVILKAERKYDSYENYMLLNMKLEALNALVQGIKITDRLGDTAAALGVDTQVEAIRNKIIDELQNTFSVSLDQAEEWLQIEDKQVYSRELDDYLNGKSAEEAADTQVSQEENTVIAGEEAEIPENSADDSTLPEQEAAIEGQAPAEDAGDGNKNTNEVDNLNENLSFDIEGTEGL